MTPNTRTVTEKLFSKRQQLVRRALFLLAILSVVMGLSFAHLELTGAQSTPSTAPAVTSTPTPAPTPVPPGSTPVAEGLAPLGDNLVRTWIFDNVAKTWQVYDPEVPSLSDLTDLFDGRVYWIGVFEDQLGVVLNGQARDLTCSGDDCWNLIVW